MPLTDDDFLNNESLGMYRKVIEELQEEQQCMPVYEYELELDEEL